jgi:hypothetical protein
MTILDVIRRLLGGGDSKATISREVMKQMILSGDNLTIHTEKLGGRKIKRDVFATPGPTGNMNYNYSSLGYMVLYDETAGGFRTFILRNITKVVDSTGKEFIVK